MNTLEIMQAARDRANSAVEAVKILAEKYPELLEKEPELKRFVRLTRLTADGKPDVNLTKR